MHFANPKEAEYPIPIIVPPPDRTHRDWVAMREIPDSIAVLQAKVAEGESALRQLEGLRDAKKVLDVPELPEDAAKITAKTREIGDLRERIFRLRAESYRRWANGFTCLCFAMIGTPVAMLRRHADVLTNFFSCFLPILVVYYPLLMLSEHLATSGRVWPVFFWTADVVLFIPAVLLLRQIIRH